MSHREGEPSRAAALLAAVTLILDVAGVAWFAARHEPVVFVVGLLLFVPALVGVAVLVGRQLATALTGRRWRPPPPVRLGRMETRAFSAAQRRRPRT